jgi:hypothetical protein
MYWWMWIWTSCAICDGMVLFSCEPTVKAPPTSSSPPAKRSHSNWWQQPLDFMRMHAVLISFQLLLLTLCPSECICASLTTYYR